MALSDAQKLAREGKLTASRVACLMTGDKEKIIRLWRELIGDPSYVEENLDDIWAIQLGTLTEQLNLAWYERTRQRALFQKGAVVIHPDYSWAAATLDGFDAVLPGPVECKHVGGYEKGDVVLQRYMPQCHWQMEVTQTKQCALSIIYGAKQPAIEIIDYDKDYADELMARAIRFMEHVYNMTQPVVLDPVEYKKVSKVKDYVMTGSNAWASAAGDWLAYREAAKSFDKAEETLRELIPNDAASCTGHGVVAKRNKALRVSIRGINDEDNGGKASGKSNTRAK